MKYVFLISLVTILSACVVLDSGDVFIDGNTLPEDKQGSNSEQNTETEVHAETTTQSVQSTPRAELGDFGPAPELTNQVWVNVVNPLRLQDLQGKVVLLEMWTFG